MDTNPQDRVVLVQEEPRGPSQLVELAVTAAGVGKVPFPDVQQLRSTTTQMIVTKAIRLITADTLVGGVLNNLVTAPSSELVKIVLVIYCDGWEKAQYIPINTLNDVNLNNGTNPHRYAATKFANWNNIDWSKSYIQYCAGTSSVIEDGAYVVMFDVEYQKYGFDASTQSWFQIVGPS